MSDMPEAAPFPTDADAPPDEGAHGSASDAVFAVRPPLAQAEAAREVNAANYADHVLLRGLNPVQQKAVLHSDGPLLLFAGAGSGKTRVLTHRVAFLVAERDVSPRNILAVTFTNKAAQEMKDRIGKLVGENVGKHLWVGTFHALCARLLRESGEKIGIDRDFVVYDDADQMTLMKEAMRQLNIDEKKFAPRALLSRISAAKEKLVGPADWHKHFMGFIDDIAGKVYPVYHQKLRDNNALDFDDLLTEAVHLLQERPEVLERLQNRYRYIMVDEYQDVNHVQYMLLKHLAARFRNLCVVGDDDQCLPPDTLIKTPDGAKRIEDVQAGDIVMGTGGGADTIPAVVSFVHKSRFQGNMISVQAGDTTLRGTPHHIVLTRLAPMEDKFYIYLMYRAGMGYRVGMTKSARRGWKGGVSHDQLGFIVRSMQEHADKMWILGVADTFGEARYWEEFYAAKYGLPMMVFHSIGRGNVMGGQEWIDRLYASLDTETSAYRLLHDLDMDACYPHYRPQNGGRRQTLSLTMFGGYRVSRSQRVGEHRIQWCSNNAAVADLLRAEGYSIRASKQSGQRLETCRSSYREAVTFAKEIADIGGLDIAYRARVSGESYAFQPLSHLHPGMRVLVEQEGKLAEVAVDAVKRYAYDGPVYDIEADRAHTYVANGVLVHNSVYGWRGADVRLILQFEHDYPEATVLKLEQNYRSTKTILEAAYGVVRNNKGRKDKKLWTENEEGVPLNLHEAENEQEEASWIAQRVRAAVKEGGQKWSNYAVLYRTNAQSRIVEEMFRNWYIPHKLIGGVRFYERKEIKDIMAYLRIIQNPMDSVGLRRIINVPARGIGQSTFNAIEEEMLNSGRNLWTVVQNIGNVSAVGARARTKLAEFASLIAGFQAEREHATVSEMVQRVLDRTGYQRSLEEENTLDAQSRLENLGELLTAVRQFEAETETPTLGAFLEQVSLVSDIDSLDANADAVTLMTLHAAKGLEFETVFLVGMEEAVFPHARSMESDKELEEERRLCYVGITRAKQEVFLSFANRRSVFGNISYNPPSRFLKEIPAELFKENRGRRGPVVSSYDPDEEYSPQSAGNSPQSKPKKLWDDGAISPREEQKRSEAGGYKVGQKVKHATFGVGIIMNVSGEDANIQLEITFAGSVGVKKLLLAYAKLEKVR